MKVNPDGGGPQRVERTQQVTGLLRIKPVNYVVFIYHDECLQRETGQRETGQRVSGRDRQVRETEGDRETDRRQRDRETDRR